MVDIDSLKNVLTGGGAFLLLFSVLGQVCYSGLYASYDWKDQYMVNYPGRYGAYYQLSLGITVLGVFALVCILVYLVFTILELSFLPDIVLKIIGLVGVVFWFGMFIAECCAIDWSGYSSTTPTKKAIANDKTVKYILEHLEEVELVIPQKADDLNRDNQRYLSITMYEKNSNFNKYINYDEYKPADVGGGDSTLPVPCIKTADNKEMCIGSWSKKKMDKFVEDLLKKQLEDEKRKNETIINLKNNETTIKKYKNSQYKTIKDTTFYSNSETNPAETMSFFGVIYAEYTSIFFGGQIVGILIFVGSIVLGFIGGAGGSPKRDNNANKSEEV